MESEEKKGMFIMFDVYKGYPTTFKELDFPHHSIYPHTPRSPQ